MSKTQPARGTRDFLPSDVKKRNYVINIIREVYESYGFEPLETPSIENLETLTGKYGEEGNQLMFKILKRGEKLQEELAEGKINRENELSDLALRYDLTVPLARVVANNKNDLPKFFKRYQIQPVWRADRPARGRYREFYQCDVDAIGSNSMLVEAELISAVTGILEKLDFTDITIRLNHREILKGMLDASGIKENKHTDALVALDKLDKIKWEGVEKELLERGISNLESEKLLSFFKETDIESRQVEMSSHQKFNLREFNKRLLDRMSDFVGNHNAAQKGIKELAQITELADSNNGGDHILIDFTLARGLSYYTGAIIEIVSPAFAGSLAGGGRYNELIGMFGKEQIPSCGISIGLERIIVLMEEGKMFPPELETNAADVLVTVMSEETAGESLKLANELRKQNLRVLVYPETDKLGKQFKYADSIGVDYVCVLGETEIAEDKVTLKNMKTGTQEIVNRQEISEKIKHL